MTSSRRLLSALAIIAIVAVSLLSDTPTPLSPAVEPSPTPSVDCPYHYELRGLGWEPRAIVDYCD